MSPTEGHCRDGIGRDICAENDGFVASVDSDRGFYLLQRPITPITSREVVNRFFTGWTVSVSKK
jgi:hypothetical protein